VLFLAIVFLTIISIDTGYDISYVAEIFIFVADVFSMGMIVYFCIKIYRLKKLER